MGSYSPRKRFSSTAACRLRRMRASAQSQRIDEINANEFCIIIKLKINGWPSASLVRCTKLVQILFTIE